MAIAVLLRMLKAKDELIAEKDKQIAESEARNLTFAAQAYPALTESTLALREALRHRDPT